MSGPISRGFIRRRRVPEGMEDRIPPGQHFEAGFPVLTVGPTPKVEPAEWRLRVDGLVAEPREWSWEEAHALPQTTFEGDIHCVTTWSKLGTSFSGVSVDELLDRVEVDPAATHLMAFSYGGYTTNLPLEDVRGGKAWIAFAHEGAPLERSHGGPARLLVPHLYFWKSAKWIAGLRLMDHDEPGFWERNGYHMYGDPWREQRYDGD
jgi:DMSO/TMAO reductase YedYZ molybdopterin-dependent catalytic subunit